MAKMDSNDSFSCIILAAGKSERFGSPKMLAEIEPNKTMLQVTVNQYLQVFKSVFVVLDKQDVLIHELLAQEPVTIVDTQIKDSLMSDSLRAGVNAVLGSSACLIALGDMPYVDVDTIEQMKNKMSEQHIVVPYFNNTQGNPVAFGRNFYSLLMNIKGDSGAKALIREHQDKVQKIDMQDNGILLDIDKPSSILCK